MSSFEINNFINLAQSVNYHVTSLTTPIGVWSPQAAFEQLELIPSGGRVNVTILFDQSVKTIVGFNPTIPGTIVTIHQPPNIFGTFGLIPGSIDLSFPIDGINPLDFNQFINGTLDFSSITSTPLGVATVVEQVLNLPIGRSVDITMQLNSVSLSDPVNFKNATSFDDLMNKILNLPEFNIPLGSITSSDFPLLVKSLSSTANLNVSIVRNASNQNAIRDAFLYQFGQYLGFDSTTPSNLGDLSAFAGLIEGGGTDPAKNAAFELDLFNKAFSAYLRSDLVQHMPTTSPGLLPTEFFEKWPEFLTSVSAMSGPTPGVLGTTSFPNVNTYKDIYMSLVPGATDANFQTALTNFFKDPHGAVSKAGYFLPSHFLSDWIDLAEKDRLHVLGLDGLSDVTNSNETAILFRVFFLLEKMLTALQNVAISQAQKEKFYANIQSEYTNLISKVPVFTVANLHATGFSDGDAGQENNRLQAITNKNQSYTQNLQAFRDLFGDQAKQQQTAVDQSNQETTQQANLATTILQQMNTIVQSIFGR